MSTNNRNPPYVLWLEWQGFYTDNQSASPQVAVRNRRVLDVNPAGLARGIKPGMSVPQTRTLAHETRFLQWQPDAYISKSHQWLDLCVPFTGRIEPIDPHIAAVDLTAHPQPEDIARRLLKQLLKTQSHQDTLPGHHLRFGTGPSKWIAQIAATQFDLEIKDLTGILRLAVHNPREFLSLLPIHCLSLVEEEHRERLEFLGYHTIGEVAELPLSVLQGQFGLEAITISGAAKGQGDDPVYAVYPPDQITESFPFVDPVEDTQTLERAWDRLARRLAKRLNSRQANELTASLKWEDGTTKTTTRKFSRPVHNYAGIQAAVHVLINLPALAYEANSGVVGITVSLTKLEEYKPQQQTFFHTTNQPNAQKSSPLPAMDAIKQAFGNNAVVAAGSIELPRRQRVLKEWRHTTGWL